MNVTSCLICVCAQMFPTCLLTQFAFANPTDVFHLEHRIRADDLSLAVWAEQTYGLYVNHFGIIRMRVIGDYGRLMAYTIYRLDPRVPSDAWHMVRDMDKHARPRCMRIADTSRTT